MKKILFLLLCTIQIYGQTSTGQEQSFPYGIVNESLQTITTPTYIGTFGTDGTQGKIPSALIAKTSDIADSLATKENIANKSDSYTASSSTTYASTKAIVDGLATKQNTLTNPITGTGTTNTIPKFTASGTVGNSSIQDSGSLVSVNSLSEFKGTTASDGGQLGTELTTTASGTNWTGTGFATGYTHTTGSVVPLTSTLAAVTNNLYQITWTITGRTTGSVTINYGGIAISGITASGNSGPKATSTATLNIVPTTDFNGTIVLSIKAISASVATTAFKNSSGAVTNEIRAHSSSSNISIGLNAGRSITTGSNNNTVGGSALQNNTTGNNNNAVGGSALQNNTTGNNNNAVGWKALASNTAGYNNSAVGTFSLQTNTTGTANNAVGTSTLQNNTTGSNNNAVGQLALLSNTTGNGNNTVGGSALQNNTTGNNNNAIGQLALGSNTTGNANNAVGWDALASNTTGSNNSAIGDSAGRYIANKSTPATILNSSIMLGYRTSPLADNQTNQVVIGYDATGLGSNTTVIGNSSTTTARVYGRQLVNTSTDNGTDQLQVNGTISANAGTTANQVVVKSQLDGKVSLTGNETIAGVKTFSSDIFSNSLSAASSDVLTLSAGGTSLVIDDTNSTIMAAGDMKATNFIRTTSLPGQLLKADGNVTAGYKVYTALLSQSGTSAPTATVLENTLGGTVIWTRVNPGLYSGTLTGAFTTDKTILLNNNPVGGVFTNIFSSVNTITIQTRNYSNAQTDDGLLNTSIEIRVYN